MKTLIQIRKYNISPFNSTLGYIGEIELLSGRLHSAIFTHKAP
jgi:hypothetical protein